MKSLQNKIILLMVAIFIENTNAQETFILNYEDVDIKKVTQDIAQFSKKNNYFRSKSKR